MSVKSDKKILTAFLLNLFFSLFECVGGLYTGSVAILSDAVHDLGDAAGIGVSWFLERRSKRRPDALYTYGYARWSVLGSVITTLILLVGSITVLISSVRRLLSPTEVDAGGMILLSVVGLAVNLCAAWFTREGDSLNQKAVNLHMLEDVLGWAVVLIGAVVMRFTGLTVLDPLLSIGVALFIFYRAAHTLKEALDLFLEKTPGEIDADRLQAHLSQLEGVESVHHLHLWSLDGHLHCATLHVVAEGDPSSVKALVRQELAEHGILHATLELETPGDPCPALSCAPIPVPAGHHHHHHH